MAIRFATQTEIEKWNELILANPDGGNLFQGYEFSQQKKMGGWRPRFIMADNLAITVLEKSVPLLGKLWYASKGPGITSIKALDNLLPDLTTFARTQGVFAVKIEPELLKKDETLADLMKLGLVRVRPIQPNFSTITLDLSHDLDTIMSNLNQKGRHAIRRAERDGVTTKRVKTTDENCRIMYDLLAETAAGSFSIRGYNYYKAFWQHYSDAGLGQLFFAYVEGKVVAAAFAIAYGKKGTYKDGASVRERTVYGASHLLQWTVITWMKEKGVTRHDLCGAPPSDQIKNPDHPHYGIGRFKTSFNKEVTDYVGAYDIVVNQPHYSLWKKLGERVVMRIHRQLHRESYY
ncbi:MAG: peptidoglycan bridge formation glycyltransferase FemA/FemB family protein [Candidatus Saccharibacteria bacterium]|nr:MAG: peptidoglycan bridge formation glycyltransferase FemA/FemB family protein [Candidatus Saccharibacteria bacterium]